MYTYICIHTCIHIYEYVYVHIFSHIFPVHCGDCDIRASASEAKRVRLDPVHLGAIRWFVGPFGPNSKGEPTLRLGSWSYTYLWISSSSSGSSILSTLQTNLNTCKERINTCNEQTIVVMSK